MSESKLSVFSREEGFSLPFSSEDKKRIRFAFSKDPDTNALLIAIPTDINKEVAILPLTEIPPNYKNVFELIKNPQESPSDFVKAFYKRIF